MVYIILYILLAVLCAWNIHFVTADMDVKIVMNRINKLRFIFAILIIFTHCTLPAKKNIYFWRRILFYFIWLWIGLFCREQAKLSGSFREENREPAVDHRFFKFGKCTHQKHCSRLERTTQPD